MKKAFTLAEVLITLGIVGIVAAVTIPTLIVQNQEKGWATSASVFERKLGEALKAMNTQSLLAGYETTEDFVNTLGQYFKILDVCKNDNLQACFSDTVIWGEEEVDMTNIKTANSFGQADWNSDIVGLHFANGVSALVAYNPDCKQNPYDNNTIKIEGDKNNIRLGTNCLAMLYDTTGNKKPNQSNKDLRGINVLALNNSNCFMEINGKCFSAPAIAPEVTVSECREMLASGEYGITDCNGDYSTEPWASAVKYCGGVNNLPTVADLNAIASKIYGTNISGSVWSGLTLDTSYNISGSIWGYSSDASYSYYRYFGSYQTIEYKDDWNGYAQTTICVE